MKQVRRIGKPTGRKRGRPRKQTITQLQEAKSPQIEFVRDLTHFDRTEVVGADPNKHYRWCEESKIPTRERQGYVRDDTAKTYFDGNAIPPEGSDARKKNFGGLVLMSMPTELHELRQKIKEENVESASQAQETRFVGQLSDGGEVLPETDEFVKGLVSGG